jgi:hypothetical protein
MFIPGFNITPPLRTRGLAPYPRFAGVTWCRPFRSI